MKRVAIVILVVLSLVMFSNYVMAGCVWVRGVDMEGTCNPVYPYGSGGEDQPCFNVGGKAYEGFQGYCAWCPESKCYPPLQARDKEVDCANVFKGHWKEPKFCVNNMRLYCDSEDDCKEYEDIGVCPYGSTQARVQKNIKEDWVKELTIKVEESFNVGSFHDISGEFADDTSLNIRGSEDYDDLKNGDIITPKKPGEYTLFVTTQGYIGDNCKDEAKVIVSEVVTRPLCSKKGVTVSYDRNEKKIIVTANEPYANIALKVDNEKPRGTEDISEKGGVYKWVWDWKLSSGKHTVNFYMGVDDEENPKDEELLCTHELEVTKKCDFKNKDECEDTTKCDTECELNSKNCYFCRHLCGNGDKDDGEVCDKEKVDPIDASWFCGERCKARCKDEVGHYQLCNDDCSGYHDEKDDQTGKLECVWNCGSSEECNLKAEEDTCNEHKLCNEECKCVSECEAQGYFCTQTSDSCYQSGGYPTPHYSCTGSTGGPQCCIPSDTGDSAAIRGPSRINKGERGSYTCPNCNKGLIFLIPKEGDPFGTIIVQKITTEPVTTPPAQEEGKVLVLSICFDPSISIDRKLTKVV